MHRPALFPTRRKIRKVYCAAGLVEGLLFSIVCYKVGNHCEDLGLIERKKGAQLKHSVEWKFFLTEEGERSLEETEL